MGSVGEALREGERALEATSTSARLDAELLLCHALSLSRTQLLSRLRDDCPADPFYAYQALVNRRRAGEPVAYIIGEREFFGRRFLVTPSVLIPRPESELLVEEALRAVAGKSRVSLLDLGTGSGCLAVTLALELAGRGVEAQGVAVDISPDALAVARGNAQALGAAERLSFVESSWLSQPEQLSPPFDIILANPPYVDPAEPSPPELAFEPQRALYSDESGLRDTREILRTAPPLLAAGGVLLIEVGAGKREQLGRCPEIAALGPKVSFLGDESSQDRFTVVKVAA